MTKSLRISDDLTLPLDAVTQTFLVVGKRGSGKSNTAARFVEQLHRAKLPFVVLDPVDTWWGLKAGLDGGRGLDVYVFGGRKQDLPLNPGDGALIADVLCEHRVSMVLSVKHLSGRARSAFMVQFAQTLFQKWGGGPLHVVLEGARVQRLLGKIELAQTPAPRHTPTQTKGTGPVAGFTGAAREPRPLPPAAGPAGELKLGKCERAQLTVLIQRHPQSTSREQLAVLSGYSSNSSTFNNALGRLRTLGLVEGLQVTAVGLTALENVPELPSGAALVAHWRGQLGKAEQAMLDAVVETYPHGLTREQLGEKTGYSRDSSTFNNAVGRIRTLSLATKGWPLRATQELFA